MAKILVADDNSNIQKMVGLALKDQGIDVVAVGNGEAAVRKIADLRPDLVLADVFMPVRNGYEVCQFVKTDSALSHIPVILLVGAFDPLDEQEAQRVGADGVLKKPFIPPDPLISMVKSALQLSGVSHVDAPSAKAPAPETFGGKEMFTPGHASVPTVGATPAPEFHTERGPEAANQSFVEQVAAKPEPLRIDSESQPVAFGSLLETPAERPEEDSSFTTTTSPEFAMEHDWRDCDEEEMDAEEEEPAAWRPEGTGDEEEVPATKSKKSKSGSNDWRMGGFEQIAAGKSGSIGWGPEEETPAPVVTPPVVVAPVEAAPVASSRAPEIPTPVETAPTASGLTRETPLAPPPLVEEKTPIPVASKPFAAETWAPLSPPPPSPVAPVASNETHLAETATVVEDKIPSASEPKPKEKEVTKDSWFSVSSSPWESEIQKASQLASTWDTPAAANPSAAPKNGTEKTSDVSAETKAVIEEAALPPIALEAIREEAAQVTQDTEFVPEGTLAASQGTSFYAEEEEGVFEPNSPPPQTSAPAATATNMDDLVAKVLAKLNPEVLQAVTREILKPVVEAMVEEELKSKKQ